VIVQTAVTQPATQAEPAPRVSTWATARFILEFAVPTALYYVLRAAGFGIYASLLIPALLSALTGLVSFVRRRRLDGMAIYMATMMLGSVVVSLVSGSTRFLLARDALLTGVTGIWFIASIWIGRPLAYLFSKPLLEGRFRWPLQWEQLWEHCPRFRRMWRISSLLWGIGTLVDAVLRVVMAYTLQPDSVPALGTALYGVTSFVLIVATNAYYIRSGFYDSSSRLYKRAT
jgi:hypothetical protein